MNNKESLIGKTISLFLEGGWEITGKIKSSDEEKFIVEQDGDLFMIFKNKISCLLVSKNARVMGASKLYNSKGQSKVLSKKSAAKEELGLFPMNGMSYEESSMSIPGGLLGEQPEDDDDLSVFFKGGHEVSELTSEMDSKNDKKIEFRVEDDTDNQD